jgi:outer membrane protein
MKNLLSLLAAVFLITLLAGSARAEGRMATINLAKVFDGFYKKTQASALIADQKAEMEKEDKEMLDKYKKAKDEYQTLQTSATDSAISVEQRDKRKKLAEDKLRQLKELEDTITEYERGARAKLAEQTQRMRTKILDEIRNVVNSKAKAGGFTLVIDTAAESSAATPIVMFSNGENDITEAVLHQLNETAPTPINQTDEKSAPKAGEKQDASGNAKK